MQEWQKKGQTHADITTGPSSQMKSKVSSMCVTSLPVSSPRGAKEAAREEAAALGLLNQQSKCGW